LDGNQFVLIKCSSGNTSNWFIIDNMRGFTVSGDISQLNPNSVGVEYNFTSTPINSTGFSINTTSGAFNLSGATYIYLIRRGPMKRRRAGRAV